MGLLEWKEHHHADKCGEEPLQANSLGPPSARDFEGQSDLKFISPTLAFGLPPSALDLIDICSTGQLHPGIVHKVLGVTTNIWVQLLPHILCTHYFLASYRSFDQWMQVSSGKFQSFDWPHSTAEHRCAFWYAETCIHGQNSVAARK